MQIVTVFQDGHHFGPHCNRIIEIEEKLLLFYIQVLEHFTKENNLYVHIFKVVIIKPLLGLTIAKTITKVMNIHLTTNQLQITILERKPNGWLNQEEDKLLLSMLTMVTSNRIIQFFVRDWMKYFLQVLIFQYRDYLKENW